MGSEEAEEAEEAVQWEAAAVPGEAAVLAAVECRGLLNAPVFPTWAAVGRHQPAARMSVLLE